MITRRIVRYLHRLRLFYHRAVESPPTLTDPVSRSRARLLNGLLVIMVPVTLIALGAQMWIAPLDHRGTLSTVLTIGTSTALILLIYLLNRVTRFAQMMRYAAIGMGLVIIVANALLSTPPHFEFAFLILLPLASTILLSLWETLVVGILAVLALVAAASHLTPMPADTLKDLIVFNLVAQVFVLFVAQQRNQLEKERSHLAIAQTRNQVLTRLLTNLSHDFRTPLSIINSSAYLLGHITDPEKKQQRVAHITDQIMRLNRILDDILYVSRLENELDMTYEQTDVNRVLHHTIEKLRPAADDKNLRILHLLADTLPITLASREHLERALTAVVENAVHYTPPEGTVTIRSQHQQDMLIIDVTDTGAGISAADIALIFDPFFRGDQARSAEGSHTGLGLTIARRVIELHGGSIVVKSAPGTGSTFQITLPVIRRPLGRA